MPTPWKNPFAQFLKEANSAFRTIQREPDVRSENSLLSRFVEIQEKRSFVFDIFDRVEALTEALNRLHELAGAYDHFDRQRWDCISAQQAAHPERVQFEVPEEPMNRMDQCLREARAHIAFLYYEMSTLVALLGGNPKPHGKPAQPSYFAPVSGSHLEYLVGVRNKVLVHARRDGRIKNSRSAFTKGEILHAHLLGAESCDEAVRQFQLRKLNALGNLPTDDDGVKANEKLLRRCSRTEKFTDVEILQLKSYPIPEPDPLESAREMAKLLEDHFLPEIQRICTERVK